MAGSKEVPFLDAVAVAWSGRLFSQSSYPFFHGIAELGDKTLIGIVVLLMALWLGLKQRDFLAIIVQVLAVALGNEVSKWLKELIARERPNMGVPAESFSFPSVHAMVGFILYFFTAYFIIRQLRSKSSKWWSAISAALIILFIGLSRIVVGAHYVTDVLGGYSLGFIWTFFWSVIYEWLHERFGKKSSCD